MGTSRTAATFGRDSHNEQTTIILQYSGKTIAFETATDIA